ncbi:MAG: bifunctional metallophosphatase/5'-nucleotidase [Tissierellia bacterium]|nr:bifunctional metallophosphatase/5'-nucleotidase [Tissierellia bacterium]
MSAKDLVKVTLLGTSDVHGFYQPWDYSMDVVSKKGGLSRVSTVYKKLKRENQHVLLLDCGDLIQGNSAELFLGIGKYPGIESANKIGYEILNMGNHEFNFGMDKLYNVITQFYGIAMMGNLYSKNGFRMMNGVYVKHFNGIKIGFISLNTPLVRHFEEKRGNLVNHDVTDADVELAYLLKEVEKEEVDALIGIFHMGDKNENNIPNTGVRDLLYHVKGAEKIDAIFGGHMHQIISKMMIKNTIFVQPGSTGEAVNRIDLVFDKTKEKKLVSIDSSVIMIDDSIESDKEVEKVLEPYHNELREYANELVGYVEGPSLTPQDEVSQVPQTRISETGVSDFYLDVMLKYSNADVVATHLDNPYPYMPSGEIKRKHIYNSYRYAGGDISNYEITGRDLKDYMEWSAGFFNQSKQGDITISFDKERTAFKYSTFDIFGNIKYDIDITKPMGFRILNLRKMDDTPITDSEVLIIGLNKYRMDFLTSQEGPLHDREFKQVWSSMTNGEYELRGNKVRGTIRNLAMLYFQDLPNQTYVHDNIPRWQVITYPIEPELKEKAIDLINRDIIQLPIGKNGDVDLSISKNIYDPITIAEYENILTLCEKCASKIDINMSIVDVVQLIE